MASPKKAGASKPKLTLAATEPGDVVETYAGRLQVMSVGPADGRWVRYFDLRTQRTVSDLAWLPPGIEVIQVRHHGHERVPSDAEPVRRRH